MFRISFKTSRSRLAIMSIFTFVALSVPVNLNAQPAAPRVIPIAEARSLPLGTRVTVEGSVTVPSGAFSSSSFDQGFAIQDFTGGIYVSVASNFGFELRQRIRVTGVLADSFGLLVLTPGESDEIRSLGRGPKVLPLPVPTGFVGERTEGRLVTVIARVTQPVGNDLPFGFKVFVNDGSGETQVFVNASTGIDVSGLHVGSIVIVTGFSGQFDDHFEVDPRISEDIRVLH